MYHKSVAVLGLAYGDEGKGGVIDALVRRTGSDLVVLSTGGPQASHHVVLPNGTSHGFAQWGSGTFAGAKTYISKYRMIEPYALVNEALELTKKGIVNPWSLLTVDPDSIVITPWHWKMNRLREQARGAARHGSCGMGVGEARFDSLCYEPIRVRDLGDADKLWRVRHRYIQEAGKLFDKTAVDILSLDDSKEIAEEHDLIKRNLHIAQMDLQSRDNVVYEGSQGFLIDEKYGFAPYNTWSDVTAYNARILSGSNVHVIGVVPCAWTRHGAGPFPSEMEGRSSFWNHNVHNPWQGSLRHGKMDLVMLYYALDNERIDSIALTKADQVKWPLEIMWQHYNENRRFETIPIGTKAADLEALSSKTTFIADIECLEGILKTPISMVSRGRTYADKEFRRDIIESML